MIVLAFSLFGFGKLAGIALAVLVGAGAIALGARSREAAAPLDAPPDPRTPQGRAEIVKRLRKIEITTNRVVNETLSGQYHSVFKGRGMAFAEVRPYQPGDEIRTIDWNVTARMGDAYVKVFTEERELTVMLLVDRSASGDVGRTRRTKAEVAAEIAAMIAFSAISNNDRVGLALFTSEVERFVPPKKGRKHVMRVLDEILTFSPKKRGTDLAGALTFLHQSTKRKSVAFVVSDFLADGWERPLAVAAQRHDVVPIVVWEPWQAELPDVGLLHALDPETGEKVVVDTSSRHVRMEYRRRQEAAVARRERTFQQLELDAIRMGADDDFGPALARFFENRARRIRA